MTGQIVVLNNMDLTHEALGQEAEAHEHYRQSQSLQREWDTWFD